MAGSVLVEAVVPGVHRIRLGVVNAYLLDAADGLTLIDTGMAQTRPLLLRAIAGAGRRVADIRRILVTHAHPDHVGGLARLKQASGARVYMHPDDAALVRQGRALRPGLRPPPRHVYSVVMPLVTWAIPGRVAPAETDQRVRDGERLHVAGGMRVIGFPGHSAGQVGYLWERHGGVLFAGDVAANLLGRLDVAIVYEDHAQGMRDLARLASLDFDTVCFGHGPPIVGSAAAAVRRRWGGG
ncbi:MAG TPA: MBL fold metallo-hydrolase [Longimicrobium sp.]|nr:MBL fold metallo-hydrolase [Longimicrobium sp.]